MSETKHLLNLNLLESKTIDYLSIEDFFINTPMYRHCLFVKSREDIHEMNQEDIEYEMKKQYIRNIIRNKLMTSKIIYLHKILKLFVINHTTLDVSSICTKEDLPKPHFIYAIHAKNMKNVKCVKVIHKKHGVVFERMMDSEQEISIPLATIEDIPKEMFVAHPKRISVIPTTDRYDSSGDLEVQLVPCIDEENAMADIFMSIGYCNIHDSYNNLYQIIQSPQLGVPYYYVNGREIMASVHAIVTSTAYTYNHNKRELVEKCWYGPLDNLRTTPKEKVHENKKRECFFMHMYKYLFTPSNKQSEPCEPLLK